MKRSKSSPSCLEGGPWVSHSPVRTHKTQSPLCILFRLLLLAFSGLGMFFPHPCIWSMPVVLCHDTTSLPLLRPPLATSDPICLHSASSASALLQLRCVLVQLVQVHCAHSRPNHSSIPDPFGPGSHTKGHHLYTLSTFVLFA